MMVFRVLHHNNCFDGACSAALFTKFHRECIGDATGYEFVGLQHEAGGGLSDAMWGPGENAIVDFKYTPSPRLNWWFDHHQSAFMTPADRAAFEVGQAGPQADRQFFNPDYISCTSWIADIGRTRFGFDTTGLDELLKWADIIDGARFPSAEAAVAMREPAMKIALVIENAEDPQLIPRIISLLTEMSFTDILSQPFVEEKIAPLWDRHLAAVELIRERAELREGTIFFDLTDRLVEGLNKFVPYALYPEATYTVGLTRSVFRTKVSVGTSPWTTVPAERLANIADICQRFGGGGHARVGAISYRANELREGEETAARVVQELRAVNPV
jgi:hypothetical protein